MNIYVLDRLDPSFFKDYPVTITLCDGGKQDVYLDITLHKDKGEVVNTIEDERTLEWIEKEARVKLQKPDKKVEVKMRKGDIAIIVLRRGENRYEIYDVSVLIGERKW